MEVFIFLTSCLCGVLSGVVYDVFYVARQIVCGVDKEQYTIKDRIFIVICDVLYFIIFAAMFIFTSILFDFYQIRLYMLAGAFLGAVLYLKSLHIFLAYFIKRLYNRIKNCKERRKPRERRKA
jgi:hypothetical protein